MLSTHRRDGGVIVRVAWLAEGATWGPLTRAVAVLAPGAPHLLEGVVLAHRTALDNEPLTLEHVKWRHVDCCTPGEQMGDVLAQTAADVIVADWCWRDLAAADGRPYLTVGMHGEGDWDLDSKPIHPWAWQLLPDRETVRRSWGVGPSVPVVGVLSPWSRRYVLENHLRNGLPDEYVSLSGWGCSRYMVGCDLVVASAGWASSWEARWSGIPHVLVNVGAKDQMPRATHTYDEAVEAVAKLESAQLPGWHRVDAPDHVTEFVHTLHRLASG